MGMVAQPLMKFFYNTIYNLRDTYILIPFMPYRDAISPRCLACTLPITISLGKMYPSA